MIHKKTIQSFSVPIDHFILGWSPQFLKMLNSRLTPDCISLLFVVVLIQLHFKKSKSALLRREDSAWYELPLVLTLLFKCCSLNVILFRTFSCSAAVILAVFCPSNILTIEVTSSMLPFLSLAARFKASNGTCRILILSSPSTLSVTCIQKNYRQQRAFDRFSHGSGEFWTAQDLSRQTKDYELCLM